MADGEDVRDLIPNDPSIRLIVIEGPITIGAKRNFGCDRALGEIICTWDDDDYSAPGRIEDQVNRLQESGKSFTGYSGMVFTNGIVRWKWTYFNGLALGTSFAFLRKWWEKNHYIDVQVGEDFDLVQRAQVASDLITVDAGDLMTASFHDSNTSPRSFVGVNWKLLS